MRRVVLLDRDRRCLASKDNIFWLLKDLVRLVFLRTLWLYRWLRDSVEHCFLVLFENFVDSGSVLNVEQSRLRCELWTGRLQYELFQLIHCVARMRVSFIVLQQFAVTIGLSNWIHAGRYERLKRVYHFVVLVRMKLEIIHITKLRLQKRNVRRYVARLPW